MRTRVDSPKRYVTSDGRTIYAICIEVFRGFYGNVYFIDDGDRLVMVDCGSGNPDSSDALLKGIESIETELGRRLALEDLDAILITHGHMDHFGGLRFVREHTQCPIGIHELDRGVLSHHEERVVVASKQLRVFLGRSGVSEATIDGLMAMYLYPKGRFKSVDVDFFIEPGRGIDVPARDEENRSAFQIDAEVIHTPGHCPGQVCMRFDDIMLTADHVLSRITPHQSPESITMNMGLGHYLDSLDLIAEVEGVRLGLGGHEDPIDDVPSRALEIKELHNQRLEEILEVCTEPRTAAEISQSMFGGRNGYDVLLALEEAGAHVEHLHQLGRLVAANLDEIGDQDQPVIRYLAT